MMPVMTVPVKKSNRVAQKNRVKIAKQKVMARVTARVVRAMLKVVKRAKVVAWMLNA